MPPVPPMSSDPATLSPKQRARAVAAALREKYAEVFGEATTTGNRTWLVRRISWRIPALAEGTLGDSAMTH